MIETELLDPDEVAAGIRIVFDDDGTLTVEDGVQTIVSDGTTVYRWRCSVCGYIHEGPEPPRWCPLCGADREMFVPEEG